MQDALGTLKVPTMPGPNKVDAGIDEVKVRLRSGRLIVHADLEQLIGEFRNYRWKNTDKSQSEDEPKREPIKANDDLLDALRYGLMSMPAKARKEREDPERGLSAHDRAFRAQLKRFARPKRQRVGSHALAAERSGARFRAGSRDQRRVVVAKGGRGIRSDVAEASRLFCAEATCRTDLRTRRRNGRVLTVAELPSSPSLVRTMRQRQPCPESTENT
jgi:hypothetical protein